MCSRSKILRCTCIYLGTLLLITGIIVIVYLVVGLSPDNPPPDICHTAECQKTADSFLSSMNVSIDPCDDFYEFACGNWSSEMGEKYEETSIDQFNLTRENIVDKLIELTEGIYEEDVEVLQQLKILYHSCVHADLSEMQKVKDEHFQDMLSTYFRNSSDTNSTLERKEACINSLGELMPFALSYKYVAEYVNLETIKTARELVEYVKSKAFPSIISNLRWMDDKTKKRIKGKLDLTLTFLGYPDGLRNPFVVNGYYEGLKFSRDDSFAENFFTFKNWLDGHEKEHFPYPQMNIWTQMQTSPATLIANYLGYHSAIFVSAGFLQEPFFGMGLRAADYGSLGFVVAHELTHAFDTDALSVNMLGTETSLWGSSARKDYLDSAKCFEKQYRKYWFPEVGAEPSENNTINDTLTLDENLADNGGLQVAYKAYQLYMDDMKKAEPKLPGLEKYSQEQIFFLSFANSMCFYMSPDYLQDMIETGVHTPHKFRVIGALSNLKEFSSVWKCPTSSRMNPGNKCVLWE